MKLTWFGGTTLRVHFGGAIVVVDPEGAPAAVDRGELVSGADLLVSNFGSALAQVDAATWRPRRVGSLIADESLPVMAHSAGTRAVLVDAPGEPPLLLVAGAMPTLGRWVDGAVVALFGDGEQLAEAGLALLGQRSPRLMALAGDDAALEQAIKALRDRLDGAGLVALEPGMALEV